MRTGPERPNAAASSGDFEFAALSEARNYRAALVRDFAPHLRGRVIEIGSGIGQVTTDLLRLPALDSLLCIEPDAGFCAAFRDRHPSQPLLEGTIADAPGGDGWNAILSINVLEHILDDARELSIYRRLLAVREGCVCLFVPARPEIYAPIDRDFGHHRRYIRPELERKLALAGFDVVSLRYFNVAGYFAWWLNFRVLQRRHFDVASVRAFDRTIFPLVHALETRVCAPPFGQSLMAVARARR